MTFRSILSGAVSAALVSFHVLFAFEPGGIRGKVLLGDEREVQAGVQVKIVGLNVRTQTAQDGSFVLSKLDEGTYDLDVSFIGYRQARLSSIRVQAGKETAVTIALTAAPFLLNEVVVTGLKTDTNDTTLVIGTHCLNYDDATHRLNPYPNRSFVVRTAGNRLVKFRVVSYYNPAGVSGYITFDYAMQ